MTESNNKSISNWQLALLIYIIPFTFKMTMLPSLLAKYMKNDIVIGIFIMLLIEFAQMFFIVQFLQWGGMKKLKERIGDKWYKLLTIPLWFVYFVRTLMLLQSTSTYVAGFLFYNIKNSNIVAIVVIVCVYLALKGSRSFGRIIEIVIFVLPIIILLGLTFGKVSANGEYLLPILANGIKPVFEGIQIHAMWICSFTPLLFFEYKKTNKKPYVAIASIATIISITFCYAAVVMNYGGSVVLINYAFARLASFNMVTTEIGGIDLPTITLWLVSAVIILGINFYAGGEVLSGFKIKRTIYLPIAGVVSYLCCVYLLMNVENTIRVVTGFIRIPIFIIEFSLPIVFFIISKFKRKNKTREGVEYEKGI